MLSTDFCCATTMTFADCTHSPPPPVTRTLTPVPTQSTHLPQVVVTLASVCCPHPPPPPALASPTQLCTTQSPPPSPRHLSLPPRLPPPSAWQVLGAGDLLCAPLGVALTALGFMIYKHRAALQPAAIAAAALTAAMTSLGTAVAAARLLGVSAGQ